MSFEDKESPAHRKKALYSYSNIYEWAEAVGFAL